MDNPSPSSKKPVLKKDDWFYLLGLGLTFALVVFCVLMHASVDGVAVFAAVVVGHKVTATVGSQWGRYPDNLYDGYPPQRYPSSISPSGTPPGPMPKCHETI